MTILKKATRDQTKTHNRKLILNIIYGKSAVSRADIARVTSLTRTTVSEIVAELINEGLVYEIGQGQSSGGKPPTLLGINESARNIIGIDERHIISEINILFSRLELDGRIVVSGLPKPDEILAVRKELVNGNISFDSAFDRINF